MRKYLYLMMAVLVSLSVCLSACGSDDDEPEAPDGASTSELVGSWEVVKTTTYYYTTIPEAQDYYNHEEVEYGNGAYWEFTSNKLTVHDENDVMNGIAVKYTYNKSKGELSISGGLIYKVSKLTSSKLVLILDSSDGQFGVTSTMEFEKL